MLNLFLINHDEKKFCLFSFWKKILYIWKWKKNHKNFLKLKKKRFARTLSFLFPLNYLCIDKRICIHSKKIGILVLFFFLLTFPLKLTFVGFLYSIDDLYCLFFNSIVPGDDSSTYISTFLKSVFFLFCVSFACFPLCYCTIYNVLFFSMYFDGFLLCVWNKKANRKKNAMWFKIRRRMDRLVCKE